MNWTKNKPTVPGWYWISYKGGRPYTRQLYMSQSNVLGIMVSLYPGAAEQLKGYSEDHFLWYGPIVPPELPKE